MAAWGGGASGKGRGGIFVPKPRGEGETLDNSAAKKDSPSSDVALLKGGDKLTGKVETILPNGRLRLRGPQYVGVVEALVSSMDRVSLRPTIQESGQDLVVLTNGDKVKGTIVAITDESVVVESNCMGALKISRKVVKSVAFSGGEGVLLDSAFDDGRMDPWRKSRGEWMMKDGKMQSFSQGNHCTVFAPLKQNEAVTMAVEFSSAQRHNMYLDLILFADDSRHYYGRNSVLVRFHSHNYYIQRCRNGSARNVTGQNYGRRIRGGEFRLAYDPNTKKAKVWIDKRLLGEYDVPSGPKAGKFVMLNSMYAGAFKWARVYKGIVPPAGASGQGKEKEDVLVLSNKDRISAKGITFADGKFTVQAPYGELKMDAGKIGSILFRTDAQERPRRRKGDVWVETGGSRITVQLKKLTDKLLIGKCDYVGEVKALREALRGIRFNIYK